MRGPGTCFIIPSKILIQHGDTKSALLSERLRGSRAFASLIGFEAIPAGERRRTIYDAEESQSLPGVLVRGEDADASDDATVNFAFDNAGATYDFFREFFQRNSIDGRGMRLDSSVHYGLQYNNAMWNGRQMIYGDGDGQLFVGFAQSIDVVAHELTHGVTQYAVPGGGLVYEDQSGALNESMSDVFGSMVKQWKLGQTAATADWLIGEGIMAPGVGKALRSMKDPGNPEVTWQNDDQPRDMDGYVEGGDVHTNSGIPNHAFFHAATMLGGESWAKAGRAWYKALPLLTRDADFVAAANATIAAATALGFQASDVDVIRSAWHQVKVL